MLWTERRQGKESLLPWVPPGQKRSAGQPGLFSFPSFGKKNVLPAGYYIPATLASGQYRQEGISMRNKGRTGRSLEGPCKC